jgi:hypothetical protein
MATIGFPDSALSVLISAARSPLKTRAAAQLAAAAIFLHRVNKYLQILF